MSVFALFASIALALASPVPLIHPRSAEYDLSTPINASLPNVTIIATGGTIASQGTTNTQTVGYSIVFGVEQLVDAVPDILNISNVNGIQVSNVDSGSVNETILLHLATLISSDLERPEISGIIVTHGTDTLAETAFFLDLVVNSSKPVVIVGAMRPATALSANGPLNLYQAVTLAVSSNARDRGAMITLSDRIGSAFYTTKNNANSLDTFYNTEAGQLGFFVDQVPYFYYAPSQPIGRHFFNVSGVLDLPQVDILYVHQDMDPTLFGAAVTAGAKGIVWAGVGAGGISKTALAAAETVFNATSVPMVASHRSVDGFVPEDAEDFYVGSGFYNPEKARILLQVSLALGYDTNSIKDVFAESYPLP